VPGAPAIRRRRRTPCSASTTYSPTGRREPCTNAACASPTTSPWQWHRTQARDHPAVHPRGARKHRRPKQRGERPSCRPHRRSPWPKQQGTVRTPSAVKPRSAGVVCQPTRPVADSAWTNKRCCRHGDAPTREGNDARVVSERSPRARSASWKRRRSCSCSSIARWYRCTRRA
jgi:hypothetical protein